MSLNIKNKRSAVQGSAPTPAQLEDGEIGVNYNANDPALYVKDSAGAVIRLAGEGAVGAGQWEQVGNDLYPKVATSDVKIGGTLPGTPNITLNANGSATFAGDVTSGTGTYSTGDNAALHSLGSVSASRTGTNVVWAGYTTGNSAATSSINAAGAAAFAGEVLVGSAVTGAPKVRINPTGYVNIQGISTTSECLKIYDPSTSLKTKLKADGSAEFDGTVLIGGTLPSSPNITLNASGSATFENSVTCNARFISSQTSGSGTNFEGKLNGVTNFKVKGNGSIESASNVSIGGDIINTTIDGDQDIICDGAGLIEVTEYNLTPMEVVTKHDVGTGANEVPLNGFLGTLAYKNDLAISNGMAVADLPTSPTARVGNIVRVTDGAAALTWGATVTGGGASQYLVWYNGTNWTVFGA